jgi:predicted flap endonuclease-1-like 5' DNA nuclease
MSKGSTDNDIRQWIQELIKRSATDQMQSMQRFSDLVQRVARGELNQNEIKDEYLSFARSETTRYVNDLTKLGLSFYNALLELNSNYNDRFFTHVAGNGTRPGEHTAAQRVEVALRGSVGTDIVKSFVVENKLAETADISFIISEFVNVRSQHERFRPPLQMEPPRFSLRPGEERVVTLRLPLLAQQFVPGQQYMGTVVVRGQQEMILALTVQADMPSYSGSKVSEAEGYDVPLEKEEIVDDLTEIKGIGPVYASKLQEAGIISFVRLAALDDAAVEKVLGKTAVVLAKRDQWQAQAKTMSRQL